MLSQTSNNNEQALKVLFEARRRIVEDGFLTGTFPTEENNSAPEARSGWTLATAIWGQEPTPARWQARMMLQQLAKESIWAWSEHPYRTRAEALALIDSAITKLGGRRPVERRGGWAVVS